VLFCFRFDRGCNDVRFESYLIYRMPTYEETNNADVDFGYKSYFYGAKTVNVLPASNNSAK
jgi:hypothetical protein